MHRFHSFSFITKLNLTEDMHDMVTELGKELRKLRVDHDENQWDMGDRLKITGSFISMMEKGTRSVPAYFAQRVIDAYGLKGDRAEGLQRIADRSSGAFIIKPSRKLGREVAGLLAREIDSLTEPDLEDILDIIEGRVMEGRE